MSSNTENQQSKSTFADFIIILLKRRKLIFWNVFTITLFALVISFFIPKWYSSRANLLPPKSQGGLLGDIGGISSTIKDLSKSFGRLGSISDEAYNYLAILQSRTTAEKVINKFNLREVYEFDESDFIEDIIKSLNNNVEFNVEDEGNIIIEVNDEVPQRAADIAAYYVEILNDISRELATAEAKYNREFIEKRYFQSMRDVSNIEDSLKEFSSEYSVFELEEQTKAAIESAAKLKAQLEVSKIERDLFISNYGQNNPLVANKELVINELEKRLRSMNYSDENSTLANLFTPFSKLPEIGVKYLRLKREYELQANILEFIVPVYEQAKLEETKNIPATLILDYPVPAEKKAGPKKAIIVLAGFLLSSILSILLVLILESFENLKKDEEKYKHLNEGVFIPLRKLFLFKK